MPFSSISCVIEEDLGVKAEELFASIDETPVGCASLAQVHHGYLKTGEEIAIKIQYPAIRKYTLIDLRDCEVGFLLSPDKQWATKVIKRLFPNFEFTVASVSSAHT